MTTMAAKYPNLKSQRGLSTVEVIPLLIVFIMLVGYAMGLFGAIHTAILHSIAARSYLFETFRNRTNLVIFRESPLGSAPNPLSYAKKGVRMHGINSEVTPSSSREGFFATRRPLSIGYPAARLPATEADHRDKIFQIQDRNQNVEVSPIWIMISYGMCLDASCGGSN